MRASRQGKELITNAIKEHNNKHKDNKYTKGNGSQAIADAAIQYINTVKDQINTTSDYQA